MSKIAVSERLAILEEMSDRMDWMIEDAVKSSQRAQENYRKIKTLISKEECLDEFYKQQLEDQKRHERLQNYLKLQTLYIDAAAWLDEK